MVKSVPHLILYTCIFYLRSLEHRKESFDQIYLNQFEKYWKEFTADTVAVAGLCGSLPCSLVTHRGSIPSPLAVCHRATIPAVASRAPRVLKPLNSPAFSAIRIFLLLFSLAQVLPTAIGAAPMSRRWQPAPPIPVLHLAAHRVRAHALVLLMLTAFTELVRATRIWSFPHRWSRCAILGNHHHWPPFSSIHGA
jgi:hypothetical protein